MQEILKVFKGLMVTIVVVLLCTALCTVAGTRSAEAQQTVDLTLERMVELGLRDSYRVKQLEIGIEQRRARLNAERAGMRSRVDLDLSGPDVRSISDYQWDSNLGRSVLVYQDTRRYEAELSIRQPVILFGYPTNGYLSVNNRMYRYDQVTRDDVRYYNRYFLRYNQPLFQPNSMRNNLEEAELSLEEAELSYTDDIVRMIIDLAGDHLNIFEAAYKKILAEEKVAALEEAADAAAHVVLGDPARSIEVDQIDVALANAQEEVQQAASSYRLQAARIKQRLRLPQEDSLVVDPAVTLDPVNVDVDQAVHYAMTLSPRMRRLDITQRGNEIRLEGTRARQAFRMNLRLTYGREVQDPRFEKLWSEPRNTYTLRLDANIPIWDWGQRKYRIQAQEYNLERTELRMEEASTDIQTRVENNVRNVQEFEQRALSMQANLERAKQITATTIESYANGEVTLVDVLHTIDRQAVTAINFLDAYLGWRDSLFDLQRATYWDFHRDAEVLDRFGIVVEEGN